MKKQFTILSMMLVLATGLFLASCGAKRDEALVTDFNAKKADADKTMAMMNDQSKQMMADHAIWTMKLDSAGKAGADAAKIADFKGQMKKMEDMSNSSHMMDSIHYYENAKTETNDELKAAIAGLDAQNTAANSSCNMMMDSHKKLGADIMAFLGGTAAAEPAKEMPMEKGGKKSTTMEKKTPPPPPNTNMDESKHQAKQPTGKRGAGTIK